MNVAKRVFNLFLAKHDYANVGERHLYSFICTDPLYTMKEYYYKYV